MVDMTLGLYNQGVIQARVRIPSKAWVYFLREKKSDFQPAMDSRLEWKTAHPFCSMLGSSFALKMSIFLFVLYVSVLPPVFHMYPRFKTHENNNLLVSYTPHLTVTECAILSRFPTPTETFEPRTGTFCELETQRTDARSCPHQSAAPSKV
ncbi:hypothetical protein TNCV_2650861 [Trichonephila clavipes]|nr:hypothetical protein TNCV_2650861 [Trichonephila clavipes]